MFVSVHLWNWPKKGARVSVSLVTFSEQKNVQTKWKRTTAATIAQATTTDDNGVEETKNTNKYWRNGIMLRSDPLPMKHEIFIWWPAETAQFVEKRLQWILSTCLIKIEFISPSILRAPSNSVRNAFWLGHSTYRQRTNTHQYVCVCAMVVLLRGFDKVLSLYSNWNR